LEIVEVEDSRRMSKGVKQILFCKTKGRLRKNAQKYLWDFFFFCRTYEFFYQTHFNTKSIVLQNIAYIGVEKFFLEIALFV
jgi:hypothetical protein